MAGTSNGECESYACTHTHTHTHTEIDGEIWVDVPYLRLVPAHQLSLLCAPAQDARLVPVEGARHTGEGDGTAGFEVGTPYTSAKRETSITGT